MLVHRKRLLFPALLLVAVLLAAVIASCQTGINENQSTALPPTDQPAAGELDVDEPRVETPGPPSETIAHTPCQLGFGAGSILNSSLNPTSGQPTADAGYFANQLLVTGLPADIDSLVGGDGSLAEIVQLEFPDPELGSNVAIGLYEYFGADLIDKAIEINAQADSDGVFVRAEPNYVLSTPQRRFDTTGAPGSPGIEGAPGSPGIEGAGGNVVNPTLNTLDPVPFGAQWAFSSVSPFDTSYLDPVDRITYFSRPAVDLVVFDSSPLPSSPANGYYDGGLCVYAVLDDFGPELSLRHFADSHGLFAASLAGPLAHEGNIHLVQVLKADSQGVLQGDLFTLLGAMDVYHQQIGSDREAKLVELFSVPEIAHTIINLSMGFTLNPAGNQPLMNSARNLANNQSLPTYLTDDLNANPEGVFEVEMPVVSLRVLFERLEAAGYVVVAAAGNDGLEMPQTPAAYPEVIGVEALHIENERACFSNRGNISAPGGGPALSPPGDNDPHTPLSEAEMSNLCQVDLTGCAANPACQEAITGHVWSASISDDRLGYWAGTSFAAPLVSGLAQSAAEYGMAKGYNLTTTEVRVAVYCTAAGGLPVDPSPRAFADSVGQIDATLLEQCVDDVFDARQP